MDCLILGKYKNQGYEEIDRCKERDVMKLLSEYIMAFDSGWTFKIRFTASEQSNKSNN